MYVHVCSCAYFSVLCFQFFSVDKGFKELIQFLMRGSSCSAFSEVYLVLVYFQVI